MYFRNIILLQTCIVDMNKVVVKLFQFILQFRIKRPDNSIFYYRLSIRDIWQWIKKKKHQKKNNRAILIVETRETFWKNNWKNGKTVGKVYTFESTFLLWNMICHYIKRAFGRLEAARGAKLLSRLKTE